MVHITLFYAGLLGLLMALLSIRVPMRRAALNAPWGDAGDLDLYTRIRAFGNFIEYAPFIILAMALLELSGAAHMALHSAGSALVFSRCAHAISLKRGDDKFWRKIARAIGAMGTWLVLVGLSLYALLLGGLS